MARPILKQELVWSGDASSSGSVAYFPDVLRGQYVEWTVYIEFSSGSEAGKVQIETAIANEPVRTYSGSWAAVGSTIDWAAQSSQKYTSVTGVFDMLRLEITTPVTTGTVRSWVIAASHAA